jgi:hypothetical protein
MNCFASLIEDADFSRESSAKNIGGTSVAANTQKSAKPNPIG